METSALAWIGVLVMIGALFLIPLGLPGLWIMIAVLLLGAIAGLVSPWVFAALLALAGFAEFLEFVMVSRLTARYGGTRRTFWGAVIGGIAGVLVGLPIPVAGPVMAAFLGTMAGAFLVTWHETGYATGAARASWGALLGRAAAVGLKVFVGILIIFAGGASLLI
jgi:uncharacterized protein YqgC (DUF456 family)